MQILNALFVRQRHRLCCSHSYKPSAALAGFQLRPSLPKLIQLAPNNPLICHSLSSRFPFRVSSIVC